MAENSAPAKKPKKFTDVFSSSRREAVAAALRSRFALRIHTSILLVWMFSAGLLTTRALLALGVQSMFVRYTLAIVVAYGAFLFGVRIWLRYVGVAGNAGGGAGNAASARSANSKSSSTDITDFFPSGGGSGGGSSSVFGGQGGGGAGGGASASFDGGGDVAPPSNLLAMEGVGVSTSGDAGGAGSGGGDGSVIGDITGKVGNVVGDISGGDDGCLIAFAIMIVVGLIALAIGGAVFVISAGPEVLIDAAFNAMLAGGLIKAGRRVSEPDWIGSVIKATWVPCAIVLVMVWIFTATAAVLTPHAHKFDDVMRIVWPLLLDKL